MKDKKRVPDDIMSKAIRIDDGTYYYSVEATYPEIRESMEASNIKSLKYVQGYVTFRLNFKTKE